MVKLVGLFLTKSLKFKQRCTMVLLCHKVLCNSNIGVVSFLGFPSVFGQQKFLLEVCACSVSQVSHATQNATSA